MRRRGAERVDLPRRTWPLAQIRKRDAAVATHERAIAQRSAAVGDALITYLDQAGIGLERAATVLDRPKAELARVVRERKAARRSPAPQPEPKGGTT